VCLFSVYKKAGDVSPGLVFLQSYNAASNRLQHSRSYSTNAQLAIDAAHRIVDSPLRHTKPVGNLLDLVPMSEQPQEIHPATGELIVESSPTFKPSARYPRADHHFAHGHVADKRIIRVILAIPLWLISRLCLLSAPLTMIGFPNKF
jgi:hypothetical protein